VDVFQKTLFCVFCGVLWCFAVFCVRVFSVFYKTAENRPKSIQNAQNEHKIRFVQYYSIQRNTVLCILLSLRKCLQKTFAKQRPKHWKTSAKHRKTLFFKKTLAKHHETPAKHPQNTAKYRETPQNTFASKTDRIS